MAHPAPRQQRRDYDQPDREAKPDAGAGQPMPSTGQAGPDVFASGFRFAHHVPAITPAENGIRVISFRKANSREVKRYEQETQS